MPGTFNNYMSNMAKYAKALNYCQRLSAKLGIRYLRINICTRCNADYYAQIQYEEKQGDFMDKPDWFFVISLNYHNNLNRNELQLFETMRHEIAHAICIKQGIHDGHGPNWQRIAKLLRVNISYYTKHQ